MKSPDKVFKKVTQHSDILIEKLLRTMIKRGVTKIGPCYISDNTLYLSGLIINIEHEGTCQLINAAILAQANKEIEDALKEESRDLSK